MARTTTTRDAREGAQRTGRSRRGFAAMDPERQREIARKGGQASGGRPENLQGVDRSEAGRKGGEAVVQKYGPEHMAEIGRRGGEASGGSRGRRAAAAGDVSGGVSSNVPDAPNSPQEAERRESGGRPFASMDPERRREIARRGGEHGGGETRETGSDERQGGREQPGGDSREKAAQEDEAGND